MPTKVYECLIRAPLDKVWAFHTNADAIKLLTPPEYRLQVLSKDTSIRNGAVHNYKSKPTVFPVTWSAHIEDVKDRRSFRDRALKSPFKKWDHLHEFIDAEGDTIVRDTVDYQWKWGPFGALAHAVAMEEKIDKLFHYRHKTARHMLETTTAVINDELIGSHDHYESDMDVPESSEANA